MEIDKNYLVREATREHARRQEEERERRAEDREVARWEARWERDKLFEAGKHMTTLSASALALLFGAARLGVENLDVPLGGSVFGLSLVEALLAMSIALLVEGRTGAELSRVQLGFSTTLFLIGLLFVVVLPSFAAQL